MMITRALFVCLAAIAFAGCSNADKKTTTQTTSYVNPPMPGIETPFERYTVNAAKGDTFFHHSGSMLLFQPDAFLDKDGKVVTGAVNIKYREFNSPVDFYLAGIPMGYDSSGTGYTLESSGMCEILAFKDGDPVFVNPDRKPEIVLASSTAAAGHNIYFLDTVKKNWVYDKPSRAVSVSVPAETVVSIEESQAVAVPPVMPQKAEGEMPVIKVVIDSESFKELMAYDNLKFQIDKSEKNFKPEDAAEEWSDVQLKKSNKKGLYNVSFTNRKRTVTYAVRPVLEGNDYDKALKVFEKNNAKYKKDIAEWEKVEKELKSQFTKDTLRNLAIEKENARIVQLNKLAEAHNRKVDSLDAEILAENVRKEQVKTWSNLMRPFEISGFGIWNCDKPVGPQWLPITSNFTDIKGTPIELKYKSVIPGNLNTVISYGENSLRVAKGVPNMIFGITDGRFAYIGYDDYQKLNIMDSVTQVSFPMTVLEAKDNNYEFIAKLARR